MRPCGIPRRIGPEAAPALALCAALWIAAWTGGANAAVTQVTGKNNLQFGDAAGDADLAGTVAVDTGNNKTVTGGAFDLGGAVKSGKFDVKGSGGSAYDCTLPSQIQLSAGSSTVTVDTFVTNKPLAGNLPAKGKVSIKVGATLQLPAGQAAGSYTGTLTLDCGTAQGSVNVTATLGSVISISSTGNLDFGKVVPTGTAGTVTVTPAGVRSSVNVDLLGGTVSAASFSVTGENGQAYAISLPSSATLTGPGANMTVDTFTDDNPTPSLPGGSDTFNVGATLHVGATQAAGVYSGSFAVTVNYN
ncbi:MAG: DUF4402 domain-containing protein [Kiloniellaceae bacterium]